MKEIIKLKSRNKSLMKTKNNKETKDKCLNYCLPSNSIILKIDEFAQQPFDFHEVQNKPRWNFPQPFSNLCSFVASCSMD